jgi:hypothetical protein
MSKLPRDDFGMRQWRDPVANAPSGSMFRKTRGRIRGNFRQFSR